jgi:hypothetical protein
LALPTTEKVTFFAVADGEGDRRAGLLDGDGSGFGVAEGWLVIETAFEDFGVAEACVAGEAGDPEEPGSAD